MCDILPESDILSANTQMNTGIKGHKRSIGQKAVLKYTRLRYELEVAFKEDTYGLQRPYVLHESLKSIPQEQDSWCKRYGLSSQNGWLPEPTLTPKTFIDTQPTFGQLGESVTPVASSRREH
jgi:hypothetical protein